MGKDLRTIMIRKDFAKGKVKDDDCTRAFLNEFKEMFMDEFKKALRDSVNQTQDDLISDHISEINSFNDLCKALNEEELKMSKHRPFTQQQVDFICYQIGEWYLEWKGKIANGKEHHLGRAKEELKMMICPEYYELENEYDTKENK